jgi:endonuclease-3
VPRTAAFRPTPAFAARILDTLEQAHPEARCALNYRNAFELSVATILSAQCTDERVNQVTETLFRKYRTPQDYLDVPQEELADDIRPTGFYNNKARSIRGACAVMVADFGGQVPQTMAELLTLPGVARKTANIVQGNSYPARHRRDPDAGIAVDTHVRRVANRLGFTAHEWDGDKIERDLMRLVPRKAWFPFTYVLIDHGRALCIARLPRCERCPVSALCPSSRVP